jgi:hypothetical protein
VRWSFQIALAFVYGASGLVKMSATADQLASIGMERAAAAPEFFTQAVGVIEVLCGIGIVFPAALGTLPLLTNLSAVVISTFEASAFVEEALTNGIQTPLVPHISLLLMAISVLLASSRWNWQWRRCAEFYSKLANSPAKTTLNKCKSCETRNVRCSD